MQLTASYDFCGAGLHLLADSSQWVELWDRGFGGFKQLQTATTFEGRFLVRISTVSTLTVADDLAHVSRGPLPEGGEADLFESGSRTSLSVDDCCVLSIDYARRTAEVALLAKGGSRFMGSASMMLVDAVLATSKQRVVHGACLVREKTGAAVLLCAPSGSGKTTTSLALAHHGFSIQTDDASVLGFGCDGPMVWGLPRALKVHRYTAELLPWLSPLLTECWNAEGEQAVSCRQLEKVVGICRPEPRALEAIIWIGSRRSDSHRLTPISKADVLIGLAGDNVRRMPSGLNSRGMELYSLLSRAVAAVPTVRLEAAPDLSTLPLVMEHRLTELHARPS